MPNAFFTPSAADDHIFLKFGTIEGDVKADGYENWIRLHTIQFSLIRKLDLQAGQLSSHTHAQPGFSAFVCFKHPDIASPQLIQSACTQADKQTATISVCRMANGKAVTLTEYGLFQALLSEFHLTSDAGGQACEKVQFLYEGIRVKHSRLDENNRLNGSVVAGYDLKSARLI